MVKVANNTNTPMPSNTYPNPLTAFPPVEGSFSIILLIFRHSTESVTTIMLLIAVMLQQS
jgi:hypothetical protein